MNPKFEIRSFSFTSNDVAKGIELEEGWQPMHVDTDTEGYVRVFAVKVTMPSSLVAGPPLAGHPVR